MVPRPRKIGIASLALTAATAALAAPADNTIEIVGDSGVRSVNLPLSSRSLPCERSWLQLRRATMHGRGYRAAPQSLGAGLGRRGAPSETARAAVRCGQI